MLGRAWYGAALMHNERRCSTFGPDTNELVRSLCSICGSQPGQLSPLAEDWLDGRESPQRVGREEKDIAFISADIVAIDDNGGGDMTAEFIFQRDQLI